jgi:hypothetical protein
MIQSTNRKADAITVAMAEYVAILLFLLITTPTYYASLRSEFRLAE